MNYFEYRGIRSSDMGLRVIKKDIFSSPAYENVFQSIPGRNGDIIIPGGRFANAVISYTVYLIEKDKNNFAKSMRMIKAWLLTDLDKYNTISDSYDVDFFRYGVFANKLDIEEELGRIGTFTITFSCKPFKYSFEGNEKIVFENTGVFHINNEFSFDAKPIYKIYGNGTGSMVLVNGGETLHTWKFTDIGNQIIIDCEQMICYNGTTLKNDKVEGDGFPDLKPGKTDLVVSGGITKIEIIPRWMTL